MKMFFVVTLFAHLLNSQCSSIEVQYALDESLNIVQYPEKLTPSMKFYRRLPFMLKCPEEFSNNGTHCIQNDDFDECPDIKTLNYSIVPINTINKTLNKNPNCSYSITDITEVHEDDFVDLELFLDDSSFNLYLDVTIKKPVNDIKDKIFCWVYRNVAKRININQLYKNVSNGEIHRFVLPISNTLSNYFCHFLYPTKSKPVISNKIYAANNFKYTFNMTVFIKSDVVRQHVINNDKILVENKYKKHHDGNDFNQFIFISNQLNSINVKGEMTDIFEGKGTIINNTLIQYCENDSEIINGFNINWPEAKTSSNVYPTNFICMENNKILSRRCEKNSTWSKTTCNNCNCTKLSEEVSELLNLTSIDEISLFKISYFIKNKVNVNNSIGNIINKVFENNLGTLSDDIIDMFLIETVNHLNQNIIQPRSRKIFSNFQHIKINKNFTSENLNITLPKFLLNKEKFSLTIFKTNKSFIKKNLTGGIIDITTKDIKLNNNFSEPVILKFKHKSSNNLKCIYWDNYKHQWLDLGIITKHINNDTIECHSYHLTRFSLLIISEEVVENITKFNFDILDLISAIELCLSMVSVFIILIIAIISRDWRKSRWNVIHLSFVMFLELLLLVLTTFDGDFTEKYCVPIGGSLHLLFLVKLSVCFLVAKMKFRNFVGVLKTVKKMKDEISIISVLATWIIPGKIVGISLAFCIDLYLEGKNKFCYPKGKLFIYSVFVPGTVLILVNTFIFIFIMFKILKMKAKNVAKKIFQVKLSAMLWFLLGGTWSFSLLVDILPECLFQKICFYTFSFVAPLEGFIIFMFYVILDKSTKFNWFSSVKSTR